jgi:predicted enzyme related to lactoylglutathione lyase
MLTVHAYVEVTEAARGIEFYCEGLGLTLKRRLSPRWIELAGANLPIFLLADRPAVADLGSAKAARNFERHWTPVHLDFIVRNLDRMVARLTRLGGSLDREIKTREYGRIANMADPFGNGFDLIEFSGSGYDAVSRPLAAAIGEATTGWIADPYRLSFRGEGL